MIINSDISVVVCVKNEESRIEGCLKSIITNHPSEIIVVDGDSSDNTAEIALKYTSRCRKDRIICTSLWRTDDS